MSFRPFLGLAAFTLAAAVSAQDGAEAASAEVVALQDETPAAVEAIEVARSADGPASAGDVARGEAKAVVCAACHGVDGNSSNPEWPKLAGQHELYTARQLALYKSGARDNAIMLGFSATLSAQDMRDIGAYFAAQTLAPGVADESLVAAGERLYRGGNAPSGVPACMACHGPSGRGNPFSGYPALAGQHADYTATMLRAFRDGLVLGRDDDANAVMAGVARMMTDAEIEAVSSYIEGLYTDLD